MADWLSQVTSQPDEPQPTSWLQKATAYSPLEQTTVDSMQGAVKAGAGRLADEDDIFHHAKNQTTAFETTLKQKFPDLPDDKRGELRDSFEDELRQNLTGQLLREHVNAATQFLNSGVLGRRNTGIGSVVPGVRIGQGIGTSLNVADAADKIGTGQATEDAFRTIGMHLARQQADAKAGFAQKAWDATSQLPAMLVEYAAAAPFVKAGGAAAETATARVGGNALVQALSRYGGMAAGQMLADPSKLAERTLQRMEPKVSFTEEGKVEKESGEGWGEALAKSAVEEFAQNYALHASGAIAPKTGTGLRQIALSTGKAYGASELASEATGAVGAGPGGTTRQLLQAKDDDERWSVIKNSAASLTSFAALETGAHAFAGKKPSEQAVDKVDDTLKKQGWAEGARQKMIAGFLDRMKAQDQIEEANRLPNRQTQQGPENAPGSTQSSVGPTPTETSVPQAAAEPAAAPPQGRDAQWLADFHAVDKEYADARLQERANVRQPTFEKPVPEWNKTYADRRVEGKSHEEASQIADLHHDEGQEWVHSGTKFEGEDKNQFVNGGGQTRTIGEKVYEDGGVRIGIPDAEGETAHVVMVKNPDGSYHGEMLKSDVSGHARALYDYATEAGMRIIPSKGKPGWGLGQTKGEGGGAEFWQGNAEKVAEGLKPAETAAKEPETKGQTLLDRMRARQAGQAGAPVAPKDVRKAVGEAPPAKPEEARSALERLATQKQIVRSQIKDALATPNSDNLESVGNILEELRQSARSRGLDGDKFLAREYPESKDFARVLDEHLSKLSDPDYEGHSQEVKDAIAQATKVAADHGIEPSSVRRGIARSLQSASEAASAAPAGQGVGEPAQGQPQAAPANAPGGPADRNQLGQPGATVPPPRLEPTDPVFDHLKQAAVEQAGYADPGRIAQVAGQVLEKFRSVVDHIHNNLKELAGKMAPRTTSMDRESGEALSRFNASGTYAREAAPYYIDRVMGPGATQEDRRLLGAAFTEMRLQQVKRALLAAGNQEGANAVKTIIGQENSPLQSIDDFNRVMQDPKMKSMLERWKAEFVPVMEDNFRRAQGMADTDPINSPTQVPDYPMNLKSVREGDPTTGSTVFTSGRGNLKNVRAKKLPFAETATGAADGYDVDLGAIIENSLSRGTQLAAKAEMFRTMAENGVGTWGKPGVQIDGSKEVPGVRPPPGTQQTAPGQTSFYVKEGAYDELRRALAPDQPTKWPIVSAVNKAFTKATLLSTVEAATHFKNQLTFLTKPGVSPVDVVKNAYGVLSKDPGAAARLVELARIGALKESGMETGNLWGGITDPTTWSGKVLDVLGRTMRLTADDAFDRLQRSGRVEGTETNRRDFINQLGQYNIRAQNQIVAFLRDTGLGPFATAGTNYHVQGLKALTMDPGVKATSLGHAVGLRAEMLAKTLAFLSAVPIANYFLWKRLDGDDNTPLGAIKIGESNGKTQYLDLGSLTGVNRGARLTGLQALAEGQRAGRPEGKTADKATDDFVDSLLEPGMGPGVRFAHTAMTGKNTVGYQMAATAKKGESQKWENLKAALHEANPVVAAVAPPLRPGKDMTTGQAASKMFGPFGVKERSRPPGATSKR